MVVNSVTLSAPGGPYTVDYDDSPDTPAAGHVNIVTETGEVIFATAPTTGTCSVTYKAVRYSDTQVMDALTQGMLLLWPEVWNPQTDKVSIQLSPSQLEYGLPAVFQDQRVVLLEVEYVPPSGITQSFRTGLWRIRQDIQTPLLIFSDRLLWSFAGSSCVLTYAQPFNSLGSIPTIASYLPCYYACSKLLLDQETMRARADDIPALTGEGAQQPGTAANTATYWLQRFQEELHKMQIDAPARRTIGDRAVERLGLSRFWQAAM